MSKKSHVEHELPLPLDVRPISNGEYWPPPPTRRQHEVMAVQAREGERVRRHLGMSRRDFARSAAGLAVGFFALHEGAARAGHVDACDLESPQYQLDNLPGEFIFDIQTHHVEMPDLPHWPPYSEREALAGTFNNAVCTATGVELPPFAPTFITEAPTCGDRLDYVRLIHLDSATNAAVLSAFPAHGLDPDDPCNGDADCVDQNPDQQSLPTEAANCTVQAINDLAGSRRAIMHHFVMPNRTKGGDLQTELDYMTEVARTFGGNLGAWKLYPLVGDNATVDSSGAIQVGATSGYLLDSELGRAAIEQAIRLGNRPLCVHKGITTGTFQQAFAGCGDVGAVAADYRQARFMIYHSGWYHGPAPEAGSGCLDLPPYLVAPPGADPVWVPQGLVPSGGVDALGNPTWIELPGPYPLEQEYLIPSLLACSGTNGLIRALRENGWDGGEDGAVRNNPNVYAELGTVWNVLSIVVTAALPVIGECATAHFLGKLIRYVGPRRIAWGTDCLWTGSPMAQIVRFREFPRQDEVYARHILANDYGLPHLLDGDVDDPTRLPDDPANSIRNAIFGRNAAHAYRLNLGRRDTIDCEDVEDALLECDGFSQLRNEQFLRHRGTPRETRLAATNLRPGFRTVRGLLADLGKGFFH